MIRFKGTLSQDGKSFNVSGAYALANNGAVRGSLKLCRVAIEPGTFTLTTEGGLAFDICIPVLLSSPSRSKKKHPKTADFEGELLRPEPVR